MTTTDYVEKTKEQPNRIRTFKVTYDDYDKMFIIVCPECGDYIYYSKYTKAEPCHCGYYWKVKYGAIGTKIYGNHPENKEQK